MFSGTTTGFTNPEFCAESECFDYLLSNHNAKPCLDYRK